MDLILGKYAVAVGIGEGITSVVETRGWQDDPGPGKVALELEEV